MANVAGDLSQQILGQSDAAKVFRPVWRNSQDSALYALVVLGKNAVFLDKSFHFHPR